MRARPRGILLLAFAAALAVALPPAPAGAQEMEVPVGTQASLLTRILAFDRALPGRAGEELVIGILYQSRYRASFTAYQGAAAALEAQPPPAGVSRVRTVGVELGHPGELAPALRRHEVDILYIAPLRAVDRRAVAGAAHRQGVLTFGGDAELREQGVAVYFGMRGGRPRLRIDLDAARDCGADFSSELLRLADVVGRPQR